MKSVLLTGATGFLGSHILRTLLEETDNSVVVLKRTFSNCWRIEDFIEHERVSFCNIDVENLEELDWENIDTIIHCATEYGRKDNSCYKVLETNLMFPIKLIELAIKHNVKTFINTDSYFNKANMSYSYLLNYSLSKKSLNLWLQQFSKKIKVINMVLEHIYGENDNKDKFIEKMIRDIAISPVESIDLTNGDQKRDFIYVGDVCKAYIAALNYSRENDFRFRQFDIGTGKPVSIKEFVKTVKTLAGGGAFPALNFGALPYRDDEIMCSYADTTDCCALLNMREFIDISTGIRHIINHYRREND